MNAGLAALEAELKKDSLASRRVELAVVSFDSDVRVVQDFVTADDFRAPVLRTQGHSTCMGSGICKALDLLDTRKATYKQNGVSCYRPWVFLITDGEPTDSDSTIRDAAHRVADAHKRKKVAFFAIGVEGANMQRLGEVSGQVRTPLKLKGLQFRELFVWLSRSLSRVSQSRVDDQMVALPPVDWNVV